MKAFDFHAHTTSDGEVLCTPVNWTDDPDDFHPIFADSEWDHVPTCDACGREHDYVQFVDQTPHYKALGIET